jgi:hypothetical protein
MSLYTILVMVVSMKKKGPYTVMCIKLEVFCYIMTVHNVVYVLWLTLRNKHKLRSFLGICTYYRWFISGFADIAKPLTRLTEKKHSFQWSTKVEATFQSLKQAICAVPILSYPQEGEKFIADKNVTNVGIGEVLSQVQDSQECIIAYYSKTLNRAERNYCITQKELLVNMRTLDNFRKYLYEQEFNLRTDHSALIWRDR